MITLPFGYDEKEDVILFGPLVLLYIEGGVGILRQISDFKMGSPSNFFFIPPILTVDKKLALDLCKAKRL